MFRRMALFVGFVAFLSATAYGSWCYYENHLTANFKRMLTAAVDPSATGADVLSYLRDARPLARSRKDKMDLAEWEASIQYGEAAQDDRALASAADEINQVDLTGGRCAHPANKKLLDLCSALDASTKENLKNAQDTRREADQDDAVAAKLLSHLRRDVGLPAWKLR